LVAAINTAIKRGDIWIHAFPHNAQPELMDATMFEAGCVPILDRVVFCYGFFASF
jgi:hypothetical protein